MPAEPSANGTDRPRSSASCRTSARPSRMIMMPKMQMSAVSVAARTATRAASQSKWLPMAADSVWNTTSATPAFSAYSATLKTSLMPVWRRCSRSAAPAPSAIAVTSWVGVARNRATASTRSPMEKLCASRFHCQCTTSTSPRAKAAPHSTHGRFRAVGAAGSERTTMTNSATAATATVAVSSMIRWDGVSRPRRLFCTAGTPFVIVVITSRPVRAGPGDAGPRDTGPGHAGPGDPGPRDTAPGHAGPGDPGPRDTAPGDPGPRDTAPGDPGPRDTAPGHAGPGDPGPRDAGPGNAGQRGVARLRGVIHDLGLLRRRKFGDRVGLLGDREFGDGRLGLRRLLVGDLRDAGSERVGVGLVDGLASHVDLTGDLLAADLDDDRSTSGVERTRTGGARVRLHGVHRGGRLHRRGQVDEARTLLPRRGEGQVLSGPHEQGLDLVRSEIRTLRDQQRSRTRDDGSRLRGTATTEQPVADSAGRVLLVQERVRAPQADHVLAGGDHVGVAGAVTVVRERGGDVVGRVGRALGVVAADGDDVGVGGRVVDLPGAEALVTDGDDDHDALVPGLLGRVGQRVQLVALDTVGTERHVQHAHVQAVVPPVLGHPVDGRDGLGDVGVTLGVSDLDADDAGVRRHSDVVARVPGVLPGRGAVPAGDDGGQ